MDAALLRGAALVEENERRRKAADPGVFDPSSGEGCGGERVAVEPDGRRLWLPAAMLADEGWEEARCTPDGIERLRCRYDFEFWAWRCVRVRDKLTGRDVPFRLNRPQRRVLALFESQRLAGRPVRAIILKARQWGGSTLVQVYMAWIQTVHCRNWHSYICAHVKDTAASIRGMYTKLLDNYPEELWEGDEKPCFRPFERSVNTRVIAGRGCRVTIGSSESQEASRGADIAMAHLSEVAFWKDTRTRSPEDLVRAVGSGIALQPMTFIVLESTANGVGSYFHNEWLRAEGGLSDKAPVFVPWHEIEIYRMAVAAADADALMDSLTPYERGLWRDGLTLEQIAWYHSKAREYADHRRMMAEYPTTPTEAFSCSGFGVFDADSVERLRRGCREAPERGQLADETLKSLTLREERFVAAPTGALQVWEAPQRGASYVVAVDVGGRSDSSDWSVVAVLRRPLKGGLPEVAAQWRGHCDHDLLAWRAAHIARWYNEALLVIESNTLETAAAAEPSVLLHEIGMAYGNIYRRPSAGDDGRPEGGASRVGFHTNVKTKALVISKLIGMVRDGAYTERDVLACNEMVNYRQLPNGAYAASGRHHDDILMTRAIGLFVMEETAPPQTLFTGLPWCPD